MKVSFKAIRSALLYLLYLIVIVGVLVELLSPLVMKGLYGVPFDKPALQTELAALSGKAEIDSLGQEQLEQVFPHRFVKDMILHPYAGFSRPPNKGSDFGFAGLSPLVKRKKDQVNICILGGSVANQLFAASPYLINSLKQNPLFQDKNIQVRSLAEGGYKQPQQLFILNFLLFLGAEYDIVINLDGFNEVALPYTDNIPNQVNPYYPRHWELYVSKGQDRRGDAQTGTTL